MLSRSVLILALVAAFPALAATPIDQSRPLKADGSVSIENIKGRIVVRTWAKAEVRVTGSLGKGAEKLEIEGDADSLSIEVKYPNNSTGWNLWGRDGNKLEPTILEVMIPQRASLEVDSVSADVDVQQVAGRELSVSSVSGVVLVTASSPGQGRFENVSGNTTLRITSSNVQAESVSGDIKLQGGLDGEVQMESVSGDLELVAKDLSQLTFSTVSGDALIQAGLKSSGRIDAESLSGRVDLRLPKSTGARVHVETFSGDINSPTGTVHHEEHGPGKSLDTIYGDGRGRIEVESFSGDVRIELL